MAPTIRQETSDIIKKFFQNPSSFSFIQAVRLLALHEKSNFSSHDEFLEYGISIVPELSLGHPSTDIVSLTKIDHYSKDYPEYIQNPLENNTPKEYFLEDLPQEIIPFETNQKSYASDYTFGTKKDPTQFNLEEVAKKLKYKIEVTFLALYGSSSPLPTFYTEELLDEAKDDSCAGRDFLDIFNQLLYIIYYKAFNRYKMALRTLEHKDEQLLNLQYALMGFANPHLRSKAQINFTDLRFIKSFIRYSRSAQDLEMFLSWRLNVANVEVEQCVPRQMKIPKNQLAKLGETQTKLGNTVIGTKIIDLNNKIRIHLKNLSEYDMQRFAYGENDHAQIENCLRIYLDFMPDFDIVLHPNKNAISSATLGVKEKSRIGVNSFLINENQNKAIKYIIYTKND